MAYYISGMATPIIRSITVDSPDVQPGQSTAVTIDAFDPDARTITLAGTVRDAAGTESTVTTTLRVGDPLTYSLTADNPAVTVIADPQVPGKFLVTV